MGTADPHETEAAYAHGHPRPLRGYAALMGLYAVLTGSLVAWARRRGDGTEPALTTRDLALITVATHRLSRTLGKDAVTSPLRAPFTRYEEPGLPSEVNEEVRPELRDQAVPHAVAELITCPFCLAQWVATALVTGQVLAPATTRIVTGILTATAGADALQFVYAGLQRLEPAPTRP